MSCYRFFFSPSCTPLSFLPSLSPFPFSSSLASLHLWIHYSGTLSLQMWDVQGKTLKPCPGTLVLGEIKEKAHCGDFLEASSSTVFTKEPFGVCVSEAGARFSKEESVFRPAVLGQLLPGTSQDRHEPPSLPFFPCRRLHFEQKSASVGSGMMALRRARAVLGFLLWCGSQEDFEQSCKSEVSLKWLGKLRSSSFRGN